MGEKHKTAAKTPETKSANVLSRKPETASSPSVNSPVDQILFLQKIIGNQVLQRLLKSGAIQAKPGGVCRGCGGMRRHHGAHAA